MGTREVITMKFRPSKCPGLVLVPTDELNLGAFDRSKGRGYVLMQDRCFVAWARPKASGILHATWSRSVPADARGE